MLYPSQGDREQTTSPERTRREDSKRRRSLSPADDREERKRARREDRGIHRGGLVI